MNVYKEDIDLDSRINIQGIYDYFYIDSEPFDTLESLDDLSDTEI